MKKIDLKKVVLSPAAQAAVEEMKAKLRAFSSIIKKNEEPEAWGELGNNGVLVVKIKANSAKGHVTADLNIPPDHWQFVQ